ncbi:MAG TPA: arabinose-binding protein, partial [Bacillota bacterium]|nr:arabinose-binding protein [Bacillota bacterium]
MVRKFTAYLLVGLVVIVMVIPGLAAPPKTTLTFWTFNELHKGFMDDAAATWNKANPKRQITLKTDVYPYDEM